MQESLHGPPLLPRRPLRAGGVCALPEDSAHHAVHVLRLREGDEVTLFNGRGGEFAARIASMQRLKISIDLLQHRAIERESPLRVTLVQGVSSGERMDSTLRKAVELGVAEVQPVLATRSVARPKGERAEGRRAHWQKVVIAACEQCGRNKVPDVQPWFRLRTTDPLPAGRRSCYPPRPSCRCPSSPSRKAGSSWPRGRRPVLRKTKRPGWSRPASCRPRSGHGCSGRIRQRLRRWLR
jgi:hypothetical protein